MMALQQVQELHLKAHVLVFMKNYILLLGNCKEGGLLAEMVLDHRLPHSVLAAFVDSMGGCSEEQD